MDNGKMLNAQTNAGAGVLAGEELARKIAELTATVHRQDGFKPFRVTADGQIQTLENLRLAAPFRRGEVTFYEALSFARFVNRYKTPATVIFADRIGAKFTAALDYHPAGDKQDATSWDLFRALLPLRHTPSWNVWAAANGKQVNQADFAQFLEDNIPDIAEPSGALLVEIARTLEANMDVSFQSHVRAENGAHRFAWLENVTGSATTKDGRIDIPAEITLRLQPFEGSKLYTIKARLRYRLAASKVTLGFELVRMQDVLTEAFDDELLKIQTEVGEETPIYNGPAPAAQQPKD